MWASLARVITRLPRWYELLRVIGNTLTIASLAYGYGSSGKDGPAYMMRPMSCICRGHRLEPALWNGPAAACTILLLVVHHFMLCSCSVHSSGSYINASVLALWRDISPRAASGARSYFEAKGGVAYRFSVPSI